MEIYIYVLKCPISEKIRYVGKTNNLKRRLQSHIDYSTNSKKKKRYVNYWILKLLKEGLKPKIELLETCDEKTWKERESYYISFYKMKGYDLCNLTYGGEGTHGYNYPKELREIRRKARLGYKVKEETKEKIKKTLSKQIYCITDDVIFNSLNEAVKYSGVPKTTFHRKLNSNKIINGKQYEYKF